MTSSDVPDDLQALVSDLVQVVEQLDATVQWAGEEITAAAARHLAAADSVNDSFPLLMPSNPFLVTEELYRAHCVELLDRVVRGEDTRPGTAVECWLYPHDGRPFAVDEATVQWVGHREFGLRFSNVRLGVQRQITDMC